MLTRQQQNADVHQPGDDQLRAAGKGLERVVAARPAGAVAGAGQLLQQLVHALQARQAGD
jgi:hypothetical protein